MTGIKIDTVAVIGAGRMGHGIALMYALDDHSVSVYDVDETVLENCPSRVESVLETLVAAGHASPDGAERALENIDTEPEFARAVSGADFVTEAVAEDLEIKQAVFERLDDHAPAEAILATNTSGLSIDDIAAPVADASRVLGTHWFNPPYIVPLVEVVKGSATEDEPAEAVHDLLKSASKTPIMVEKDIPGFIGNRIQTAMSCEAFSLLARGVATPADIDKAVKAGFGLRLPVLGIFEKMDQSGLGIHHEVEKRLMPTLDRGTEPNDAVTELLENGDDGWESGKGIYDWTDVSREEVTRNRDAALLDLLTLYREANTGSAPPANYDNT
jgi:3-hydroxyacyl-CoA dehydrogenase